MNMNYLTEVLQKVLLIQPSSAASERVFCLLKASFTEQQDCSLQDYVELCYSIISVIDLSCHVSFLRFFSGNN